MKDQLEKATLENFLAGKPLTPRMARLMSGEDQDESEVETVAQPKNYADGTAITNNERKHLDKMLKGAGWQVLLKLLDTELKHQEDTARRFSLEKPLEKKEQIVGMWAELASDKAARDKIVFLAENEAGKLVKKAAVKDADLG